MKFLWNSRQVLDLLGQTDMMTIQFLVISASRERLGLVLMAGLWDQTDLLARRM